MPASEAHLARPDAGGADDGVRRDPPLTRVDAADPVPEHVDADRLRAGVHPDAALPGGRHPAGDDGLRGHVPVERAERGGEEPRRLEPGHELGGLRDRDLPGRNVELGLEAERPAEERHVLWASSRNR